MNPTPKAWFATGVFAITGLWGLLFYATVSDTLWAHVMFYTVLTINSFFSVRLFSRIQPAHVSQYVMDAALVAVYFALAFSIGRPLLFAFFALAVFIVATPKYALMLGKIPHNDLLRRKILIDLTGIAFCALVLAGTLIGYEIESAWTLAIGFTLANVYLLLIRPMYRL